MRSDVGVAAWIVSEGTVEVFLVRDLGEGRKSPRYHLYTVPTGGLLISPSAATLPDGTQVVTVGVNAQLDEVDVGPLLEGGDDDGEATAIDRWIERLLAPLSVPAPAGTRHEIAAQTEPLIASAGIIAAREGVIWLWATEGAVIPLEDASLVRNPMYVACTRQLWATATGDRTVCSAHSTSSLRNGGLLAGALDDMHGWALRAAVAAAIADSTRERARIDARSADEGTALVRGVSTLSRVLSTPGSEDRFADLDVERPIVAAFQLVARAIGAPMNAAEVRLGSRPADPVAEISDAVRIRTRRVLLRGSWWKEDGGPLLAFLAESQRPVALLPASGGFEMLDVANREVVRVTPEVARGLEAHAHMLYAPYPQGEVTMRMLAGFAGAAIRGDILAVIGAGAAASVLGFAAPLVAKYLFDYVIPTADRAALWQVMFLSLLFAVVGILIHLVQDVALTRIEAKLEVRMEGAMMDRLLRLPATFFKQFSTGDLAARATSVTAIRQELAGTALGAILSGLFSISSLVLLLAFDHRLALLGLALGLVCIGVIAAASRITLRADRLLTAARGRMQGLMLELLSGVPKLRVAGAEGRAFSVWASQFAALRRVAFSAGKTSMNFGVFHLAFPLLTNVAFFAVVIAITTGAQMAGSTLSPGDFVAVVTAFGGFLAGILGLGAAALSVMTVIPLWERARPILKAPTEVSYGARHPGSLRGGIELNNVRFQYAPDGPAILDDVSIRIMPGEHVALVGPSGSGKTTLVRLMLGLERPTSGALYFDGQDLATLDIAAVRRQIGTVLQFGSLLPGDLFRNIVGETSQATLADAWDAARLAGLDQDIEAMPMGMFTVVSEGASTFSGGQRQRLLIARALVHKPRIVFFDEATSALDNRTQRIVTEGLDRMNVTRIVVAHRLSTIVGADRIIVLREGRVVEQGSYDDLMAAGGAFAELAARQLVDERVAAR